MDVEDEVGAAGIDLVVQLDVEFEADHGDLIRRDGASAGARWVAASSVLTRMAHENERPDARPGRSHRAPGIVAGLETFCHRRSAFRH
jgi:hypothetical protein